jgi:hypothetical protein
MRIKSSLLATSFAALALVYFNGAAMSCGQQEKDEKIQSITVDPAEPSPGWTLDEMRKAKPPDMSRKPRPQQEIPPVRPTDDE